MDRRMRRRLVLPLLVLAATIAGQAAPAAAQGAGPYPWGVPGQQWFPGAVPGGGAVRYPGAAQLPAWAAGGVTAAQPSGRSGPAATVVPGATTGALARGGVAPARREQCYPRLAPSSGSNAYGQEAYGLGLQVEVCTDGSRVRLAARDAVRVTPAITALGRVGTWQVVRGSVSSSVRGQGSPTLHVVARAGFASALARDSVQIDLFQQANGNCYYHVTQGGTSSARPQTCT